MHKINFEIFSKSTNSQSFISETKSISFNSFNLKGKKNYTQPNHKSKPIETPPSSFFFLLWAEVSDIESRGEEGGWEKGKGR